MFATISRVNISLPKFTLSLDQGSRFRLVVWFSLICLATITIISFTCASLLSAFITQSMLHRDARVAMNFVNSIVQAQQATSSFHRQKFDQSIPRFFEHITNLPEVLRANVYGQDRKILWSSDSALIGRRFDGNKELELAFGGVINSAMVGLGFDRNDELELAFGGGLYSEIEILAKGEKEEHIFLPENVEAFVENYLPIWSDDKQNVIGVVEVYRVPKQLLETIQKSENFIWGGAIAGGLTLFAALLLILRLAMVELERQEKLLLESERLAVIGEMASATAHGLRNPLAAIRSSAELALEDNIPNSAQQPLNDIVSQSNILESWIRGFLITAREGSNRSYGPISLDSVIDECLDNFVAQMNSQGIQWHLDKTMPVPIVNVDVTKLRQIINSIVSNSIEAMPDGGELTVKRLLDSRKIARIIITDTGPGIPEEMNSRIFEPFVTSKDLGLGIGLSLARRDIERMGGSLEIQSKPGLGVTATLTLPEEVRR